ncbi:Holliday junction resolvase RecU [Sporosarcina sp. Marseille-Q4943]|uniref:Holliday junction resolvase RecU n=1 Tax=Sporosarcina sp. Marseille-Q4943 TaxID=2942204 RepID=UPI00208DB298|nr:Holliday junction resolvase RecU [Sporosarcina sp. Marseille-Q4943]
MRNIRKTYSRSHANRGAVLERLVDITNKRYCNKGVADIRKIPTPVQITKHNGRTVTGYTQKGEWVDYVGVYDGRTIVFDAKETRETTRFPLSNISAHQFELLKSWHEKGARSFLLVSFSKLDEIYLLKFERLQEAWSGYVGDGRKSIPYEDFVLNCDQVKSDKGYVLHYLKYVG